MQFLWVRVGMPRSECSQEGVVRLVPAVLCRSKENRESEARHSRLCHDEAIAKSTYYDAIMYVMINTLIESLDMAGSA